MKNVGGADDDKIVKSIRAGNAPDVALSFTADKIGTYCGSKAWIDLGPYIKRDKVDLTPDPEGLARPTPSSTAPAARCRRWPTPTASTTTPTCCKAAGYTEPPKTATELLDMAVKLTKYNADGSIKVAGFVPLWGFYEMAPAHVAPLWDATWATADGKSNFAADPNWAAMLTWQKKFVDAIGYDKLRRFTSGAGDSEFAATNLFETGKLAMNIDGEYRTAFIQREHPELSYAHRAVPGRRRPAEPATARATSPATRSASRKTSHRPQPRGGLAADQVARHGPGGPGAARPASWQRPDDQRRR